MPKNSMIRIPPADSFTIRNDLAIRGLTPVQVEKVMEWLVQQKNTSHVSRTEVEEYFQRAGFSQEQSMGVIVTLIKESARPKARVFMGLVGLGLLALIAFCTIHAAK